MKPVDDAPPLDFGLPEIDQKAKAAAGGSQRNYSPGALR
jgi:hypothetical protein